MSDLSRSMSGAPPLLNKSSRNSQNRIPELDGVRGIGALAILFYHLWPTTFFLGWTRVDLFFVLSGYLITSILLRHPPTPRFLLTFWGRRALRIWPAYYLLLTILYVREILNGRSPGFYALISHVTFTQNLPYYWSGPIPHFSSEAGHTWALAIEEQFYLVWPLIVILAGRHFLIPVALWLISSSVAVRMLGFYPLIALARCDGLALGAILAVLLGGTERSAQRSLWFRRSFALIGLVALLFLVSSLASVADPVVATARYSPLTIFAVSVFYCTIVGLIVLHTSHPLLGPLRFRVLEYIGRISYGIYLYHLLIIDVVAKHSEHGDAVAQFTAVALSLLAGAISWECLEQPLGNLKKRFPYERGGTQAHAVSPHIENRSIEVTSSRVK